MSSLKCKNYIIIYYIINGFSGEDGLKRFNDNVEDVAI